MPPTPGRRPRAARPLTAALLVLVLAVSGCSGHPGRDGHGSTTAPSTGIRPRVAVIPADGGVSLVARVYRAADPRPGPLVVMPGSWGAGPDEYDAVARPLAAAGYVVVAYAQRGFGGSGGSVDLAGPATQRDVSTVVDWALHSAGAAGGRVAAVGVSYGAVMSLLAAERDPRITVAVAMSGWGDLTGALAPGGVLNVTGLAAVLAYPGVAERSGPEATALRTALVTRNPQAAATYLAWLEATRSPVAGVAALNRNGTAVMLANAYQDSLLSPASLVPFFDRLTGPKRLQLESGDHAGPERVGLRGGRSQVWQDVRAWLDLHLRGQRNAIADAQPVQLRDGATGEWHGYRDTSAMGTAGRLVLRAPKGDGTASDGAASPWTAALIGGVDTSADAGPSQFDATRPYEPPTLRLSAVPAAAGARWSTAPVAAPTTVSGEIRAHLRVADSAARGAVFGYVYDVAPSGTGTLVTLEPHLVAGVPGAVQDVELAFPPVAWTLAAGHRLALVVDTVDPRYEAVTTPGTKVTLSSTAADPATLTVPVAG